MPKKTSNAKLLKSITVPDLPSNKPFMKRFKDRAFKSYRAVAKELKPGETVTVAVHEYLSSAPSMKIHAGYGEVERVNEREWYEPARLIPEV